MFHVTESKRIYPTWQTANRKWALHGQNCPTSQIIVVKRNMKTDIFLLHVLSSFFSFVYRIKSWNIENYLDWNTNVNVSVMLTWEYWNRVVVVACKYFPGIIPIPNLEFLCQRGNKTHFSSLALVSGRLVEKLPKEISLETELIPSVSPKFAE